MIITYLKVLSSQLKEKNTNMSNLGLMSLAFSISEIEGKYNFIFT